MSPGILNVPVHSGVFYPASPTGRSHRNEVNGGSTGLPIEDAIARLQQEAKTLLAASGAFAPNGSGQLSAALDAARRDFGEHHPRTLEAMRLLATAHNHQGRASQAISLAAKVVQRQMRLLGHEHPATLNSINALAAYYANLGDYAKSEQLFLLCLRGEKRRLADDHPTVLITATNLGALQVAAGRYRQAELTLTNSLARLRHQLGESHPATLHCLRHLAELHVAQDRSAEADRVLDLLLTSCRRAFASSHPATAAALQLLGQSRFNQRRYQDAGILLEDAWQSWSQSLGPERVDTLRSIDHLARCRLAQRQFAEAERLLRGRLAVASPAEQDDWQRAHAQALLGAALLGQGARVQAKEHLSAGCRVLAALVGRIPHPERDCVDEARRYLAAVGTTASGRWAGGGPIARGQAKND